MICLNNTTVARYNIELLICKVDKINKSFGKYCDSP